MDFYIGRKSKFPVSACIKRLVGAAGAAVVGATVFLGVHVAAGAAQEKGRQWVASQEAEDEGQGRQARDGTNG